MKTLKIGFTTWLILFALHPLSAQIGGRNSFEFLDISANPRTMGLGGANVSLAQEDVNMFLNNPAVLDSSMAGIASLNYSPFFGRTPHFLLTYAHNFEGKIGLLAAGLQYIRYGKIQETDEVGNIIGEFLAADYALTIGKSFRADNFRFGVNLKLVGSQIASYNAFGVATDLGVSFKHPENDFRAGLIITNLGGVFKKYLPNYPLRMPFDARLGVSFKPYKMPFRFSVTAYHLYRWDIAYNDPAFATTTDPFTGQTQTKKISFANNLFRHFVFGTEIIFHKNFHLRLGYNHLRNQELKFKEITALAGFSGGLAFRVKGYEVAFTRAGFARKGLTCLAISKNLKEW